MNPSILLTNDYSAADLPRGRSAVWLHHRGEPVSAERAVELGAFLDDPKAAVREADLLVVCGLVTRLCTPGNRVRLGQFLTEPWWGPPRVSVDRCLFVREPWRMWWHWGCVGASFGDYFTSYRLEHDWRQHVDREAPDPCDIDTVRRHGAGIVRWDGGFAFDPISVRVEPMSRAAHGRYQAEKTKAFDEEKTAAAVIRRLSAFAAREYPPRQMPADLWKGPRVVVRATDFPVDGYQVGMIRRMVGLTNDIAEAFRC